MSPSSAGRPLLVSNSVLPFKLKLALNDRVVKEKDFFQDTVRIGRASDNDVILPDKSVAVIMLKLCVRKMESGW